MADDSVRRIGRDELGPGAATPGMARREAVSTDGMWAGVVETEPGATSGWHHHGEYESTLHIVRGRMRMEFGPGGSEMVEAGPGDFLYVAPYTVHREGNPAGELGVAVVVRAGHGPAVFNVEGPDLLNVDGPDVNPRG
ncbi:MAG TPA: cupin domain-containing protein [Acidimicrobiales bacterium]|nr:cupin domain-containing protein [Acidimicrobiales bacterium]